MIGIVGVNEVVVVLGGVIVAGVIGLGWVVGMVALIGLDGG